MLKTHILTPRYNLLYITEIVHPNTSTVALTGLEEVHFMNLGNVYHIHLWLYSLPKAVCLHHM